MENKQYFDTDRLIITYFRQSLPVVFSMAVTLVYNLVDTYFIGRTNDAALVAGVSLCGPLFMMLMAVGNIFGQGGSSLIARMLGKGDRDSAARISAYCFYGAILAGAVIAVLLMCFRFPCLKLLGADAQTLPHAASYYTVLALASPAAVLTFIHSNLLRSEGLSALSVIGMIAGSVLNIILDPIMITVLGWGARGAAVATALGYILTDVLYIFIVKRKSACLSMDIKAGHVNGEERRQILSIGLSAAITNIASSVCMIVMYNYLSGYGNEKIAALGIVTRIISVIQLVIIGFSFGAVPLFGYLYGAREKEKLKKLLRFCTCFLCGLALAISLLMFAFAVPLVRVFIGHEAVIEAGTQMLRWQVSGMVFAAVVLLFTCFFQGTGKAVLAFVMSLSRQGLLFLVLFSIATAVFGFAGFLASQLAADFLSAVLALLLYRNLQQRISA